MTVYWKYISKGHKKESYERVLILLFSFHYLSLAFLSSICSLSSFLKIPRTSICFLNYKLWSYFLLLFPVRRFTSSSHSPYLSFFFPFLIYSACHSSCVFVLVIMCGSWIMVETVAFMALLGGLLSVFLPIFFFFFNQFLQPFVFSSSRCYYLVLQRSRIGSFLLSHCLLWLLFVFLPILFLSPLIISSSHLSSLSPVPLIR